MKGIIFVCDESDKASWTRFYSEIVFRRGFYEKIDFHQQVLHRSVSCLKILLRENFFVFMLRTFRFSSWTWFYCLVLRTHWRNDKTQIIYSISRWILLVNFFTTGNHQKKRETNNIQKTRKNMFLNLEGTKSFQWNI